MGSKACQACEGMTKNHQKDHAEVIWSDAIPDLDISDTARVFCPGFPP
jgi:hypothetical protein